MFQATRVIHAKVRMSLHENTAGLVIKHNNA